MRAALIILLLINASKAEDTKYTQRCSNSLDTNFTFEPSVDKVEGRYKLEWCTEVGNEVTKWILSMQYIKQKKKCGNSGQLPLIGSEHSHFELPVTKNLTCTDVCFSTFMDLVFNNTCYRIATYLADKKSKRLNSSHESYHYITNKYTKELFSTSKAVASTSSDGDGNTEVQFNLGHVPASFCTVKITDNVTKKLYVSSCVVRDESPTIVKCKALLKPGHCYKADLKQDTFWATTTTIFGNITDIFYIFCVSMPGKAGASASPTGEWPMALATAVLLLVVVTVWCIIRRRHIAAWQKRVRDHWLQTTPTNPTEPSNVDGNILLLYARDCTAFKRAAESLGVLVQRATGCQVIDVYSGAATRLWAPAPDEWLRLLLARDETRVVLLQSPAGVLLATELTDTSAGPGLVAPLLGARMTWRRPHAGDALLSLALRQLAAAPLSAPYKKYYVANIGGQGADMAAGVTPHRRYALPEAAACLLRDLAPGPAPAPDAEKAPDMVPTGPDLRRPDLAPLLQHFTDAAAAFTLHVRDHPDYLTDELLPEQ